MNGSTSTADHDSRVVRSTSCKFMCSTITGILNTCIELYYYYVVTASHHRRCAWVTHHPRRLVVALRGVASVVIIMTCTRMHNGDGDKDADSEDNTVVVNVTAITIASHCLHIDTRCRLLNTLLSSWLLLSVDTVAFTSESWVYSRAMGRRGIGTWMGWGHVVVACVFLVSHRHCRLVVVILSSLTLWVRGRAHPRDDV